MIYLVYGNQDLMIQKQIQKIVNDNLEVIDDFSYNIFDSEEDFLIDIIQELETLPLVYDKKVIVIKNANFLIGEKLKKEINGEEDYVALKAYLNNPNPASILIFSLNTKKINQRIDFIKIIKEKGTIIEIADLEDKEKSHAIKRVLSRKNIKVENNKVFESIVERLSNDWNDIMNNIIKLELINDVITLEMVEALIPRPLESNIFGIVDSIIEKDIKKALQIVADLKIQNEDPLSMLPLMASQLRFLYQVIYLYNRRYQESEIVKELEVHQYRVTLALRKRSKLNEEKLLEMINELAILDLEIKTGVVDKFQAFEMYLIKHG